MTIRITDTWIAFKDSDIFWSFKHSPVAILALAVTLLLMISALFAQIIAPFNPYDLASLDLMNAHLPPGVSVMRTARVADDFHARFSALKREYRYFIWNASSIYPHAKPYAAWLKHGGYDWAAAAEAAKFLEGEHDFRNFCRLEGYEHTTVRRIERARLVRRGRLIVFQIRGDGFLHNMVRIILGNLELAALGKIRPEEIKELLDTENRTRSDGGRTFPACGLWFWKVTYGAPIW